MKTKSPQKNDASPRTLFKQNNINIQPADAKNNNKNVSKNDVDALCESDDDSVFINERNEKKLSNHDEAKSKHTYNVSSLKSCNGKTLNKAHSLTVKSFSQNATQNYKNSRESNVQCDTTLR